MGKRKTRKYVLHGGILLALVLGMLALSQRAFATTYTITDGERVVTLTTFATDPAKVIGEAGLELAEGDTYTTEGAMGAASITINRTRQAEICYRGEWMTEAVGEETVGQVLHRLSLNPGRDDVVTPDPETPVTDGMEIRVDRVVRQTETYTRSLAYAEKHYDSSQLPAGTTEVLLAGQEGELLCTAEVTYVNGEEQSRKLLEERVTLAPVDEILAVGTGEEIQKPEAPVISDGYITLPTGEVLTYTKKDTVRATAYTHTDKGCDTITATGTTVRMGTVAVDPRFIPYGTRMFIVSNDGMYVYGLCAAEDCGGAIKRDRVDLYFPTYEECMAFGRRTCTIYFLG